MKHHFKYIIILFFFIFSQPVDAQNLQYEKLISEVKGDSLYALKEYGKALVWYEKAL